LLETCQPGQGGFAGFTLYLPIWGPTAAVYLLRTAGR